MNSLRIVVADDHILLRDGLRNLIGTLEGVEVVGEASDGVQALELVKTLRPDLLMTDIAMPRLDGLGLTAEVTRQFPETRVIILSMHTEGGYAEGALRAGATGYLVKDSGTAEVELAIRAVARGESYLSPVVSKHIITSYNRMIDTKTPESNPLTPRQLEVLKLIAEGHTTKSIASRMDISVKTADTHRVQLMERLDIHDIAGLVRYAIRNRLIDQDC